ncbi:MAG: DUF192 domain-containing protein [Clostridia bacterium]
MKTIRLYKNNLHIADVWDAKHYFQRLRGLIGHTLEENGGILLTPCNQIHTYFMGYSIDVIYLDGNMCVIKTEPNVIQRQICGAIKGAVHVLELSIGSIERKNIVPGDILEAKL